MPINKTAKKAADKELSLLNKKLGIKLSSRKIIAEMEKIMDMGEEKRADTIITYCKGLAKEIFKDLSFKRSLMEISTKASRRYLSVFGNYTISQTMTLAKSCANLYLGVVDASYANKFELTPEQMAGILRWEQEEAAKVDTYTELSRTIEKWDKEVAAEQTLACEDRLGEKVDKNYRFNGDYTQPNDFFAADMYCKATLLTEELAKHNKLWKLLNFKKVAAYNKFINTAKDLLAKVGFDADTHGTGAIEKMKKTTYEPYKIDISSAKDDYVIDMERYRASHAEKTTLAHDYIVAAGDKDRNPETSIMSKIRPYAEKYGIPEETFNWSDVNWAFDAKKYDEQKDISPTEQDMGLVFLKTLKEMINKVEASGQPINITDILNDARQVAVITAHHYSPIYGDNVKEFMAADHPPYLFSSTDVIKNRLNMFVKKADEATKAEIIEQAAKLFDQWRENGKQLMAEDKEFAMQSDPVEKKEDNIVNVNNDGKENAGVNIEEVSASHPVTEKIVPPVAKEKNDLIINN